MAYFVVERDPDDGCLRIPLPEAYETRDAAIAALSAATAAGAVTLTGEVFIADLGSAVPVLVMQTVAPVATPSEPEEPEEPEVEEQEAAEAEELEGPPVAESGVPDELPASAAVAPWEPLVEIPAEESALADALKRATTSLESEGIVAPASIAAESPFAALADVADEPIEGEPGAATLEDDLAEIGEPSTEGKSAVGSEDEAIWPWANVESYEIPAESTLEEAVTEETLSVSVDADAEDTPAAEEILEPTGTVAPTIEPVEAEQSVAEEEPVEAEQSVAEEPAIITSAPADGEETYMPQPVILGDYVGSEPVKASEASAEPDSSVGSASPFETGYAATGEVDFGEYTCQDCVYSNTCPKVGQTSPAECGSFQWRSE